MHIKYFADVLEEYKCELATIVGDEVKWRAVREHPVLQEWFPDFCSSDAAKWDCTKQISEAVCDH